MNIDEIKAFGANQDTLASRELHLPGKMNCPVNCRTVSPDGLRYHEPDLTLVFSSFIEKDKVTSVKLHDVVKANAKGWLLEYMGWLMPSRLIGNANVRDEIIAKANALVRNEPAPNGSLTVPCNWMPGDDATCGKVFFGIERSSDGDCSAITMTATYLPAAK